MREPTSERQLLASQFGISVLTDFRTITVLLRASLSQGLSPVAISRNIKLLASFMAVT